MATICPRAVAFINEANGIAPGRRKSSDGTYANKPGGHNVGARGLVHAADLSLSKPGTPYWEPHFEVFDVHALCRKIAAQYIAAGDAERSRRWPWLYDGGYMHIYDAGVRVDVIFTPTVSLTWRVNNSPPSEHIQHAHFEVPPSVRAEQDTQPIFGEDDDDVNDQDKKDIANQAGVVASRAVLKELPELVQAACEEAIAEKFAGFEIRAGSTTRQKVPSKLIIKWREDEGLAP